MRGKSKEAVFIDEQRWTRLDREMGDWHYDHKSMQCKQCVNKLPDALICKKYPQRKPEKVIWCEEECPKFEQRE